MAFPYLPEKQVKSVILGGGYSPKIYKKLIELGIEPLFSQECTNVLQGIRNHADLGVFQPENGRFFLSKEQKNLSEQLTEIGVFCEFIDEDLTEKYPNDVLLNAAIVGNHIFYNPKTASSKVANFAKESNLIQVHVSQGYTKCSIAPVTFDALITDDISIGSRAKEFGLDVLLINKGDIKLKNFNYGFIGGATGKISADKLVITGKIETLSDSDKIKSFLFKHDVELIELTESQIEDIGSIIPVCV